MPYQHEFLMLETSIYDPAKYNAWPTEKQLPINSGIIEYLWDSLTWLPTDFAHNKSIGKTNGIDPNGVCVLWRDGSLMFGKICRHYASIFELGPSNLMLTSPSCCNTDAEVDGFIPVSAFKVQKTKYERDLVVRNLRDIADLCDLVAEKNNTHYLAHRGL